jgi:hypothetical protein
MLKTFYNSVKTHYDNLPIIEYEHELLKPVIKHTLFMDKRICTHIKKHYKYTYLINYKNINVYYSTKSKLNINHREQISRILKYILIVKSYFGNTSDLNLYVWNTKYKKKLTTNKITPYNVNSGATFVLPPRDIYIWREEELFKVLIHELCHHVGYGHEYSSKIDIKLSKLINIDIYIIGTEESYVETMANIMNTCICSLENSKSLKQFIRMHEMEIDFSLKQISKILKHLKYKQLSDILQINDKHEFKTYNTSVFGYYIIKGLVLTDIETYFTMTNYYEFIISKLYNIELNNKINKLIKHKNENKNMCMSITEY